MYLGIIAFGTVHALIFLPVLLSVCGPDITRERLTQSYELPFLSKKTGRENASSHERGSPDGHGQVTTSSPKDNNPLNSNA